MRKWYNTIIHNQICVFQDADGHICLSFTRVMQVDAATVQNGHENEEPCNESFEDEESQPESVFSTPESFCRRSTRRKVCPRRYGAGNRSARVNGSLSGEKISALLRRSPRTRALPMKYAAEDFRKVSCDQISRETKCLPPQVEVVTMEEEEDGGCDLSKQKQEELGSLKQMKFDAIRSTKIDEKERMREELKLRRQKALEERERLREEERMKRQAVRERLRMARSILKEAQRSSQKRKREREKECKKRQLQELKEKKTREKRRMKELCSAPAVGVSGACNLILGLLFYVLPLSFGERKNVFSKPSSMKTLFSG